MGKPEARGIAGIAKKGNVCEMGSQSGKLKRELHLAEEGEEKAGI
jgi:hypothetical protein